MKKVLFFLTAFFICLTGVNAKNYIYDIDVDIKLDQNGNAEITENWNVKGSDGTEWYKAMYNLGNSNLSDFVVLMDGKELKYKNWDINESLNEKSGYYGINYVDEGQELCFGKSDYNQHLFTLKYKLTNFIFNTSDSQILYWQVINELSDVKFNNFSVNVTSFYKFPDTLDVWGYGYKGYAYVKDGKIQMSNEDFMTDNYAVLLVKFPLNTFDTSNSYLQYSNFDSVYNKAEEGSFEYDYNDSNDFIDYLFSALSRILSIAFVVGIPILIGKAIKNSKYGYKDNKVINKKNTPMFRDIPCNKDIYYANALIKLNNFNYKESNILGSIILKWVKEEKIAFKTITTGLFNKETSVIDLTLNPTFKEETETKLFNIMYTASEDGLLETKEFENWAKKNYSKFFDLFKNIESSKVLELKSNGHIYQRTSKEECKFKNVMDDTLYNDSKQLYGLKLFLEEFSTINTREVIEVKLWDEYLMFAYLFGIADRVAKQLKNMYPEIIEQSNLDYNSMIFISNISTRSVSAASAARSAAESYSAGGGGFSSGGGGGGSFGGGGGGSR